MHARHSATRVELDGVIASAGFASGDRIVVGHWASSPLGPMTDVMWVTPDDERVLLAPTEAVARFVTAVYGFDRVEVVSVDATMQDRVLRVRAGTLTLAFWGGRGWALPLHRPPAFTRWVEGPAARLLLGVRTYGVTSTGVREWYRASHYHRVTAGQATLGGRSPAAGSESGTYPQDPTSGAERRDLGELRPLRPPLRVGVSEPPRRPSMVWVRPLLVDPSGRLGVALEG